MPGIRPPLRLPVTPLYVSEMLRLPTSIYQKMGLRRRLALNACKSIFGRPTEQIGGGRHGRGRHVFNQHVCTMLERLRLECFHMAVHGETSAEALPHRAKSFAVFYEPTCTSFILPSPLSLVSLPESEARFPCRSQRLCRERK